MRKHEPVVLHRLDGSKGQVCFNCLETVTPAMLTHGCPGVPVKSVGGREFQTRVPCLKADRTSKRAWHTAAAAREAARAARKRDQSGLGRIRPYRCPNCGLYHLGHDRIGARSA